MAQAILKERSSSEWREYVAEATRGEISAILEKGRRISEFHEAYIENPTKFGKDYAAACVNVLRISQPSCSRYEQVFKKFGDMETAYLKLFPADIQSLVFIAQATNTNPSYVEDAMRTGQISSDMSRDEASQLRTKAENHRDSMVISYMEQGLSDFDIMEKISVSDKDLARLRKIATDRIRSRERQEEDGPDVAVQVINPPSPKVKVAPPAPTPEPKVKVIEAVEVKKAARSMDGSPFSVVAATLDALLEKYTLTEIKTSFEMWVMEQED